MGSLCSCDPLDWDYQSSYLSNTTSADNHRIGFTIVPSCPGQPGWASGYDHGDYVNDQCDGYDVTYYYCDGCSRDKHTNFSYAFWNAPHSLHNMLLAFIYYDW